jgi:glycosyltransferase involved in cell wall biosynthesis
MKIGFDLPVLEAMALGAPVITSSSISIRDIVGTAALLVDPFGRRLFSR